MSHSESVQVEFDTEVDPAAAREALASYSGITVVDDPANSDYPMPLTAADRDDVFVGRLRRDSAHRNGLALWFSCDNLRKGAALNALQILDEVVARGCLRPAGEAAGKADHR